MTRPPTMHDMGWLLSNFADSIAGIAHVIAVSAHGLLLASSRDLPADRADQLAAITVAVLSHRDTQRHQAAPEQRAHQPGSQLYASRWVSVGRAQQTQPWRRK